MEGGRHKPRRMGRVFVTLPLAPVLYSIFVLDFKVHQASDNSFSLLSLAMNIDYR